MARAYTAKQKKYKTEVEGAQEIIKLLKEMGKTAEDVLEEAARAGGMVALNEARKRVPVNTGTLKRSLYLEKGKKTPKRADTRINYGKDAYYGKFVELGTRNRAATPFMRPAVDENKRKISKQVTRAVAGALRRFK